MKVVLAKGLNLLALGEIVAFFRVVRVKDNERILAGASRTQELLTLGTGGRRGQATEVAFTFSANRRIVAHDSMR